MLVFIQIGIKLKIYGLSPLGFSCKIICDAKWHRRLFRYTKTYCMYVEYYIHTYVLLYSRKEMWSCCLHQSLFIMKEKEGNMFFTWRSTWLVHRVSYSPYAQGPHVVLLGSCLWRHSPRPDLEKPGIRSACCLATTSWTRFGRKRKIIN